MDPANTTHVTRIAPSPTGDFHLGSARTAYFNYLIARATGGRFILRIDDTDLARNTDAAVAVIDDTMSWLKLDYDARLRQSDRLPLYRGLAAELLAAGLARRDGDAIRLRLPDDLPASWTDSVAGAIAITDADRKVVDGLVLMKSDGMPTYHFASVVDDMDLGITWVVRGVDHLSNTARHVALWTALSHLDWSAASRPMPRWTHVGLITQKGRKISKRDGAASLLGYRDADVDSDALLNWVLRLGWGPTVDDKTTKMLDRERALALFLTGGRMRSSPANMDPALLAAYDRRYKGAKERAERGT